MVDWFPQRIQADGAVNARLLTRNRCEFNRWPDRARQALLQATGKAAGSQTLAEGVAELIKAMLCRDKSLDEVQTFKQDILKGKTVTCFGQDVSLAWLKSQL